MACHFFMMMPFRFGLMTPEQITSIDIVLSPSADSGTERTFKFTEHTKLRGAAAMTEGNDAIPRDTDKVGEAGPQVLNEAK